MATLRDFGLAPEEPASRPPRRHRYEINHESGARPLPRDRYQEETYDAYGVDPLDEEVELPGVSRGRGLLFGIGMGVGVAVLAIAGGLYFGGYVDRTPLGPTPDVPATEAGVQPFEATMNEQALAQARIAPVWISEAPMRAGRTQQESADIQIIDQTPPETQTGTGENAPESGMRSNRRSSNAAASGASEVSGEEMDQMDAGVPAAPSQDSTRLSNELDALQRSISTPRGPSAPPKAPTNDQSAPGEPNLPPPAAPTAPAETPDSRH